MNKMLKIVAFAVLGLSLAGSVFADQVVFFVSGGVNGTKFTNLKIKCHGQKDRISMSRIGIVNIDGVERGCFIANLPATLIWEPLFEGNNIWTHSNLTDRYARSIDIKQFRCVYYTISQAPGGHDFISKVELK